LIFLTLGHSCLQKKATSSSKPSSALASSSAAVPAAALKKRAVKIRKPGSEGPVLGGADYLTIAMGGRKRAREEARRLPVDE
jgi:hypothetical protein